MNDRDRTMSDLREEQERLRRRIAELESRGAGARCGEELEVREQAIQSSINGIALADLNGTLTFVNQSFLTMWGYDGASEVLGRPAVSFWDSAEQAERIVQELGKRGWWVGEMTAKRKNGDRFPAQLSATVIKSRTESPIGMMASFIDITERRQAEERSRNVARLYTFLSQINQAIVRIRDRDELFLAICRVAVEFGRFRMAWAGLVDEATGMVKPVAHAGLNEGYLELLSVRTGNVAEGKGPTGSALREGNLVICDDIAADPRMQPWRDEAIKRGYRSSAAIPFRLKDRVIGTLNLYASEPGFFTEDERKLLAEIGVDISFALDNMERENERIGAEEALRESEHRYRTLFDTMAQGIVYQAQDGRIISANPAAERILGVSLDQLQGRTSLDPRWRAVHENGSDFPGDQHPAMVSLRTGRPVQGVVMGVFHPIRSEYRWILIDAVPEVLPGETKAHQVYATFTDITERRKAEEALQAAKGYAENLIETANAIVVGLDLRGTIAVFNRAAEEITGYSRSELQGRNWFEVLVPKDRYPHVWSEFERLQKRGLPRNFENPILTKSGEERYIVWQNNVVYEHGEIAGTISFGLDITDRRKTEEALQRSEERLSFMMSNSPSVIYTCRPSGDFGATFVTSNVVHQLGYEVREFLADPGFWAAHIHPDDKLRVFDGLSTLFTAGSYRHEYRFRHKDGTWRWMHDELKLVRDAAGDPVEIIGSWVDITDRKRAEENLLQRTKALATLLEVSKGLAATLNMEDVLQATTDGVTHLFGPGTSAVYLLEGDTLRLGATTPPLPPDFPEELRIAPLADHPHIREAISGGTSVLIPDMAAADLTPAERAVSEQRGLRTVLYLPLIAGVKSVGTLIVGSAGEPRAIPETEIDLCRTLANLAALAVENARLYKSGQHYAADLEQQVAERKHAEEALRESERKYRTLFDSASDAVFILDLDGTILDVNRTAHTRLGYTKQELLSMHIRRLDPPEFAARVPERLAQISRSGMAVFESAHLRKDGSAMPVEINSRVLEYEGRQVYFSIVRDITDRKRAEDALRESEERFRTLLARVDSVAVQGFGPDGIVHYWNKASERLYGYTAAEAEGRSILDLIIPGEARGPIADAIAHMAATGTPLPSSETTLLCKDGSCVTVHANYAVVNMPGRPPELYCIDIDLTDRKRAEQERLELERRLLHAQKLESLGILAGGIAHDFNNLLMAVLGNLDLALRKVSPVSPARANIEHSAQAARRATDLTRQMLAYSGKGRFLVRAMDLSELVEENTHLFRSGVARTATLDVRLDRALPPIEADAGQVQQVIMNLITNASEAIGDSSGRIIITTGVQECDAQCLKQSRIEDVPPAGRFVYLEVSDTGCGMDEQTQLRLFDPFFTTKAPGRGLGMSAILGIVRGHGGALFVESGPGRGTSIRILFPALENRRAESGAAASAPAAGMPMATGTVLVVDDEEIVRMVCKEMVEAMGLPVLTAVDGRDAVDVFTSHRDSISHVILDLSMPNMDGMTAFTELVRIKPGVKVIMSSGYDEQESIQRMSGRGIAGFIQKPYSLTNLREALEKA